MADTAAMTRETSRPAEGSTKLIPVVPASGFRVYVGDCPALSGLPLRGGFTVTTHTPAPAG